MAKNKCFFLHWLNIVYIGNKKDWFHECKWLYRSQEGIKGQGAPPPLFSQSCVPPPPWIRYWINPIQYKHNSCSHVYRAITVSLSPRTQRKGQKSQRFLGQSMSLRSGLWSQYQSSVVICQAVGPAGMSDLVLLYPLSYLPLYPRALVYP